MAQRRVIVNLEQPQLRLVITERSTVALEPQGLKFGTIEEAVDHVAMNPLEFPSEIYEALLERLESLRGGAA
jgi:hypothetical protein